MYGNLATEAGMLWAIVTEWLHAGCTDEEARLRGTVQRLTTRLRDCEGALRAWRTATDLGLQDCDRLLSRCTDLEARVKALEPPNPRACRK